MCGERLERHLVVGHLLGRNATARQRPHTGAPTAMLCLDAALPPLDAPDEADDPQAASISGNRGWPPVDGLFQRTDAAPSPGKYV
jgi:hypothetical protein